MWPIHNISSFYTYTHLKQNITSPPKPLFTLFHKLFLGLPRGGGRGGIPTPSGVSDPHSLLLFRHMQHIQYISRITPVHWFLTLTGKQVALAAHSKAKERRTLTYRSQHQAGTHRGTNAPIC